MTTTRAEGLGDVLFFGTFDERVHPRVQVLRQGLRAHGAEIHVLNRPLGIPTVERVGMLRHPLRLGRFAFVVARRWLGLVRGARRLPSRPGVVVVGYLGHLDVWLARLLFRRSTIVLDHLVGLSDTARDRQLHDRRLIRWLLETIDRQAMARADIVVFDTAEHRDHLDTGGRTPIIVRVGAPTQVHDVADDRSSPEGVLRVLFFGLFTPLQGAATIGHAIARLADEPGVHFTIVGDGQDWPEAHEAAKGNPNTEWIRWTDPSQLPSLLARHDVCLGIFGTTAKAQRVVANKVYQGCAAGAAVITSDTPPQRLVLGDAAIYVPAGDAEALAEVVQRLHLDRDELARAQQRARDVARRSFTPAAVTRELAELLQRRPSGDG